MISDLDTAMDAARKAGKGGPMDAFLEQMADRVGGKAGVQAAFGDPIERDGITVIPVAKVRWGFGGGGGTGPKINGDGGVEGSLDDATKAAAQGSGSGAGGGVMADPLGYLEIGPEGASYKSITPPMPSPFFLLALGATVALVLGGVARLIRR